MIPQPTESGSGGAVFVSGEFQSPSQSALDAFQFSSACAFGENGEEEGSDCGTLAGAC